ncbi:Hint domain-containing protein [Acetobacteraceae bacterium KSS8]|uniref:Hint domain-containing protein n=1 Tax=Endosaccharibacter trunci TaxID=2812733 RepID=A0ABT1W9R3_9PROT|nr:Hint domain-containing protein [Acetobacteraceae bacterium KSS8]
MAVSFNTTYIGGQLSSGLIGFLGSTESYTGTSIGATGASYAVTGTVAGVGSAITVTRTIGTATVTSQATYAGYFVSGGATYYVFNDPTLFGTGGAFAVSANKDVLASANLTTTVTQSLPTAVCFLAGTGILTPAGEAAIETIQPGDAVLVLRDGTLQAAPVRWVGHGSAVASELDDAPIRILKDALADGVPKRDLLVTPEHCLHLDGVLIPVRMLVNGGSIVAETAIGTYDYFHVELDRHEILLAQGAGAESYLDTGNRTNFRNNAVSALVADFANPTARNWSESAAAPLAVERATVEPIWTRLAARARSLGLSTAAATAPGTADADLALRIVTEAGEEILPSLTDGHVYAFVVPARSGALRLRSRSARPSESIGPFVDDRRALGVQIGRIGFSSAAERGVSALHLQARPLAGWHDPEAGGTRRWTDGDAVLPIDASASGESALFLDVEVVSAGPYRTVAQAA